MQEMEDFLTNRCPWTARAHAWLMLASMCISSACHEGSGGSVSEGANPQSGTMQPMQEMVPMRTEAGEAQSSDVGTAPISPGAQTTVADAGQSAPKENAGSTAVVQKPSVDATDEADAGMSVDPTLVALCSGCQQETPDKQDMTIHLHHVHLNVADRERSMQFYEQFFQAERVLLNDAVDALHVVPTLLLLDQRATAPDSDLPTALQHIGWGSSDPGAWYDAAHAEGIAPDTRGFTLFNTDETPTIGEPGSGALVGLLGARPACFPVPDRASYMYVLGADSERIEVWAGVDRRVNHLHFTTADLATTVSWYQDFLGLEGSLPVGNWTFFLDDILCFIEPIGAAGDYMPTDDHVWGHFALSVSDLDAWRKRAQEHGVEVVSEPSRVHGFTSFFVRGPDGMLIELVQATPSSELCPSGTP